MFTFFSQSLLDFKTVGSFVPSSQGLCHRLTSILDFSDANNVSKPANVLELGSGCGVVSRYLVTHRSDSINTLVINEINESLLDACEQSVMTLANAQKLNIAFLLGQFPEVALPVERFDKVVCSIPLNSIPSQSALAILEEVKRLLSASDYEGASFSFYEYLGARTLNRCHSMISTETSLSKVIDQCFLQGELSTQFTLKNSIVFKNFTPARVWTISGF